MWVHCECIWFFSSILGYHIHLLSFSQSGNKWIERLLLKAAQTSHGSQICFCFLSHFFSCSYCKAKPENCNETQCKLLPVGEGFASEFRRKVNEKGVRLVYLNLKTGNNSYDPLELQDEFLPHRWVWANTIIEPMLSLPDDYDILSMGLLTY